MKKIPYGMGMMGHAVASDLANREPLPPGYFKTGLGWFTFFVAFLAPVIYYCYFFLLYAFGWAYFGGGILSITAQYGKNGQVGFIIFSVITNFTVMFLTYAYIFNYKWVF